MEPRFQSTFIPKGPVSTPTGMPTSSTRQYKQRDFFSLIANLIFGIALILAVGVFGYKYFLNYRIDSMGKELEAARASLQSGNVGELVRLNARLASTEKLLKQHRMLIPVFDFLEASTPKNVRFTNFDFNTTNKGLELVLRGEAQSYAALAAASTALDQNLYFKNPVFSDISLDTEGNVVFAMRASVDAPLLSYDRFIQDNNVTVQSLPVATTTATSSVPVQRATSTATSTRN